MIIIETNLNYRKPLIPLDLRQINYIILHHPSWSIASPRQIHNDVLIDPEKKNWNGFPYNEYIEKDGTVYIGRGDNVGSQCAGMNSVSYGICCEGDYDVELTMPQAQKESLIERIKYNRSRFPNYKSTVPHKQFGDTSCPGKYFPIVEILKIIEAADITVDEAMKIIQDNSIINSPEYWNKVRDTTKNFDQYVINVGKRIQELKVLTK
jgi:hypothetical protein